MALVLHRQGLSLRQCHRGIAVAAAKQQAPNGDASATLRPITAAVTAGVFVGSLLNGAASPPVEFACAATALAAAAAQQAFGPATPADLTHAQPPAAQSSTGDSSSSSSSSDNSSNVSNSLSGSQQQQQSVLYLAAAAGAAAVLSAVLSADQLPAFSSMCLLVNLALVTRTEQKQRQEEEVTEPQKQQQQQQQEQQEEEEGSQQLQQELQRRNDQLRSLKGNNAQLQRELRQKEDKALKAERKVEALQAELKQAQAVQQDLNWQLLEKQQALQEAQEQLVKAEQAQAKVASEAKAAAAAQQQEQQADDAVAGSAAAGGVAKPRVVAFVGGLALKESDRKLLPQGVEVRHYGSPRDAGTGEMKRLEAAIKSGGIDEVYVTVRWNGHNTTEKVAKLCKDRQIPYHLLADGRKTERKADYDRSTSGSSDEE